MSICIAVLYIILPYLFLCYSICYFIVFCLFSSFYFYHFILSLPEGSVRIISEWLKVSWITHPMHLRNEVKFITYSATLDKA